MSNQNQTRRDVQIIAIGLGLVIFGILYAIRIALRPFPPHRTWLSVVVGDAATDVGSSLALWSLTGDWRLCLVPWIAHALTGGPMIIGQVLKHYLQDEGAQALCDFYGRTHDGP